MDLFLYGVTVLFWGTSWLAMKFQLGVVAPEVSVAYRFAIAALIMLVFCFAGRRPMRYAGARMPELPEVETIRRHLAAELPGRRVESVWTSGKALRVPVRPAVLRSAVGCSFAAARRFPSARTR